MNTKIIEPMNVIRKIKSKLIKRIEVFTHNKIRFKDFVSCLSNGVIIRASFMTKRISNFKSINKIVDDYAVMIFKVYFINFAKISPITAFVYMMTKAVVGGRLTPKIYVTIK